MEALRVNSRGTSPSVPPPGSRRGEAPAPIASARSAGPEPVAPHRAAAPVFRRPALQAPAARPEAEPTLGPPARAGDGQPAGAVPPRAPPSPPFEWLDLEIIPLGQKPDPRGYGVYARAHQPMPAPVLLIEVA